MYVSSNPAERARWQVIWVHNGARKVKKFHDDFASALAFYTKATARGAKGVMLRCQNMAFAPPAQLRPHARVVKRPGRKKPERVRVVPMRKLNREGTFWCPYCIKLRRFKQVIVVGSKHLGCNVCGITVRDHHVRLHNPMAVEIDIRERN